VVAWGVLQLCSRNLQRVYLSTAPLAFSITVSKSAQTFQSLHWSWGGMVQFHSITKAQLFKFFCYELWAIVHNNMIWNSISRKQRSQSVDRFISSCWGHSNNFWPFRTSIDDNQPHLYFKGTIKIYVKQKMTWFRVASFSVAFAISSAK